jgi:hypothetical protein
MIATLSVAALAAGPIRAQGSFQGPPKRPGTFSSPSPTPSYSLPQPRTYGAPQQKTYGAPEPKKPEAFKPYEPYKPKSVFGPDGKPRH